MISALFTLLLLPYTGQESQDADHQTTVVTAVLLSAGDPAELVETLLRATGEGSGIAFPQIMALEPGPLQLDNGLRLLPNQVSPRLTRPQVMLISTYAPPKLDDLFVAFLRRCLQDGTHIWLVGPNIPEALLNFPLEPGQVIRRVPTAQLPQALRELATTP